MKSDSPAHGLSPSASSYLLLNKIEAYCDIVTIEIKSKLATKGENMEDAKYGTSLPAEQSNQERASSESLIGEAADTKDLASDPIPIESGGLINNEGENDISKGFEPDSSNEEQPNTSDNSASIESTLPGSNKSDEYAEISFCRKCGAPVPSGQAFCGSCGAPVNAQANPSPSKPKHAPKSLIIGLAVVAIVAVSAIALFASGILAPKPEPFDFAEEYSNYDGESWCTFGEDGSYMTIDTNPYDIEDYLDYDAWEAIPQVNEDLGFPDSTYENMGRTRALDGAQSAEVEGFRVSWRYHPNNGLEVTYERVEQIS